MKQIKTIEDLVKLLQDIRDVKGSWTACVQIFADGSGKIFAGSPHDGKIFAWIGDARQLQAEVVKNPTVLVRG